jgi:hypothetical protein
MMNDEVKQPAREAGSFSIRNVCKIGAPSIARHEKRLFPQHAEQCSAFQSSVLQVLRRSPFNLHHSSFILQNR